eukprot:c6273_g1_i1.p1 GENE.c6273_g1_i1~~c6273_g1_i1.p1  ORF type:complete len:151 (+),score=50.82 c6273_g1_i1:639-1091(+)
MKIQKQGLGDAIPPPRPKRRSGQPYPRSQGQDDNDMDLLGSPTSDQSSSPPPHNHIISLQNNNNNLPQSPYYSTSATLLHNNNLNAHTTNNSGSSNSNNNMLGSAVDVLTSQNPLGLSQQSPFRTLMGSNVGVLQTPQQQNSSLFVCCLE